MLMEAILRADMIQTMSRPETLQQDVALITIRLTFMVQTTYLDRQPIQVVHMEVTRIWEKIYTGKQDTLQQHTLFNSLFQGKQFMWNNLLKKYPKEQKLNFGKIYGDSHSTKTKTQVILLLFIFILNQMPLYDCISF